MDQNVHQNTQFKKDGKREKKANAHMTNRVGGARGANSKQVQAPPGAGAQQGKIKSRHARGGDSAPSGGEKRAGSGHVEQERAHEGRPRHGPPRRSKLRFQAHPQAIFERF